MNTCANLHMRILNSSTPARKIRQTLKAQISLKTATATSVFHTKRAVKIGYSSSKKQRKIQTYSDKSTRLRPVRRSRRGHQHVVCGNIYAHLFQRHFHCAKYRCDRRIRACLVRRKLCRRSRFVFFAHTPYRACAQSRKTCVILHISLLPFHLFSMLISQNVCRLFAHFLSK